MSARTTSPDEAFPGDATGQHDTITLFPGERQRRSIGLARGSVLGRYVALRALGSGGMGIVYLAYDADLDRNVAVKLCRSRPDSGDSEHHQVQLLAEAKALARLSHPNVVQVFDAGVHKNDVFFVMELVEGETLASWLERTPRSRSAILEQFREAGEGLAAIHRAGLVHRDVKPGNLIIGHDGRLRVVDLGLASVIDTEASNDSPESAGGPDLEGGGSIQIGGGGTPAYMAPEVRLGAAVDSRSDQFSFCVSLLEALTGRRPSCCGAGPAAGAGLPRWLSRVLSRGLAVNPAERFESMDAMLAALARHPWRIRRFRAAALVVAAVGAAYFASQSGGSARQLCSGAEERLGGVWDADRRASLIGGFAALEPPYATAVGTAVATQFDAYAGSWSSMHTEVCQATHVRGEQSESLMDLRMACLEDQRLALVGATDLLIDPSADLLPKAMKVVNGLPSVAPCANIQSLLAMAPRPTAPEVVARIERASAEISRSEVLEDAGQFAISLPAAEAALAVAETVDYPPLLAQARRRRAEIEGRMGNMEGMRQGLFQALEAAQRGQADREAAQIWLDLVIIGWRAGDHDEADRYAAVASSTIKRLGGDAELESQLYNRLGMLSNRRHNFETAVGYFERSLAAHARAFGDEQLWMANATHNLSVAYRGLERYREAEALYKERLGKVTQALGEDHPDRISILHNLSIVQLKLGEPSAAVASSREGSKLAARVYGARHLRTAMHQLGLGEALLESGEAAEALGPMEHAYDIYRSQDGDPIDDAHAAYGLARVLRELDLAPSRWRALANEALSGYEALGQRAAASRSRLEAWLEDGSARPPRA